MMMMVDGFVVGVMRIEGDMMVANDIFNDNNFCVCVCTFLSVARFLVGEQEDILRAAVTLQFVFLQQPVHPLDDALQAFINI